MLNKFVSLLKQINYRQNSSQESMTTIRNELLSLVLQSEIVDE